MTLGLRPRSPRPGARDAPDWEQADPAWIRRALSRALARPSGGWIAVDASRRVGPRPRRYRIAGRDLVAWRGARGGRLFMAPDVCPHMGAPLSEGRVRRDGCIVCPWHGLALGEKGRGGWRPLPAYDDGVIAWVQISGGGRGAAERGDALTSAPILPERPARFVDAAIRLQARCEPADVIANRLDPWHGVHFHPHSFGRLRVVEKLEDEITVRVTYRVGPGAGVEVDARFHCPEPNTIAMTIVDGEGAGSVVETHAAPVEPGRTAILEATLASSSRRGFSAARRAAALIRPWIRRAAHRLWVEDAAYAERRYALRRGEVG